MGEDARELLAKLCTEFNAARTRAGYTTAELAAAAGVPKDFVEAIEHGLHRELGDCAAVVAVLGQRLALVETQHAHSQYSPARRDGADSSAGATVLQLPVRDRRDGEESDDDGLPGVW